MITNTEMDCIIPNMVPILCVIKPYKR